MADGSTRRAGAELPDRKRDMVKMPARASGVRVIAHESCFLGENPHIWRQLQIGVVWI